MQSGDALKVRPLPFGPGTGQVLIPGKMYGHPELGANRRLHDPQYASDATHAHGFAQGDFRGHDQGQLHRFPDSQRVVSKKERTPGAEILGKAAGVVGRPGKLHVYWNVESKTLSGPTLEAKGSGSHGFLAWKSDVPLLDITNLTHNRARWKFQIRGACPALWKLEKGPGFDPAGRTGDTGAPIGFWNTATGDPGHSRVVSESQTIACKTSAAARGSEAR